MKLLPNLLSYCPLGLLSFYFNPLSQIISRRICEVLKLREISPTDCNIALSQLIASQKTAKHSIEPSSVHLTITGYGYGGDPNLSANKKCNPCICGYDIPSSDDEDDHINTDEQTSSPLFDLDASAALPLVPTLKSNSNSGVTQGLLKEEEEEESSSSSRSIPGQGNTTRRLTGELEGGKVVRMDNEIVDRGEQVGDRHDLELKSIHGTREGDRLELQLEEWRGAGESDGLVEKSTGGRITKETVTLRGKGI